MIFGLESSLCKTVKLLNFDCLNNSSNCSWKNLISCVVYKRMLLSVLRVQIQKNQRGRCLKFKITTTRKLNSF